ncbi:MAG: ACP S-malonyltransferase [Firmicutes bacterium]|nr:ACP S-malonyltransferase [Bacillota bacterium]
MITYVFPGQGSQSKGMGGSLFDEFKDLTAQADQILGYSIKELCMEDPNLNLNLTQYTQPALYIVNAFTYLSKIEKTNQKPDFVAGHSLGEYDALFAAGAFDFITGLKLVQKRGELMGQATGGGMAAVIGLNAEQIMDVLNRNRLNKIDVANFNSPFQIVISGPKAEIDNAKTVFEGVKGVKMYIPLKTSGAFHSRYMEEAKKQFEDFLNSFQFLKIQIPVISNVYARPYQQASIKSNLIDQITRPVKWTESIRYLMGLGEMKFEELGPGKVLSGLIQQIKKEAEPLVIKKIEFKNTVQDANQSGLIIESNNLKEADSPSPIKATKSSKVKNDKHHKNAEYKQLSNAGPEISAFSLGSSEFKKDYNIKYAYLTGGMYRGIASKEVVLKMGNAGMMGFLGTGGWELSKIESEIRDIQREFSAGQAYGVNFLYNPTEPVMEEKIIDLFLALGVKVIEASAFMSVTPSLVRYHAKGLKRDQTGKVITTNKIIAKLSRPEVAEAFLSPAPERILTKLLAANMITLEEAELSKMIPVADDICAEADSGGHTDGAVAYALVPAMIKLRDEMMRKYQYPKKVRVGAAGGIGTPEAAAAAFVLGADFVVTGSINQCTVEAGTSDTVKDLLQQMNIQDTEYAPAGDMFEYGAKAQVLKKGLFFPVRANKLYDLYRQYNSLDEIDEKTKIQIQEKYFKRSFSEVYEDIKAFFPPQEIEKAEQNPKHKMALIFRWYFGYSSRLALSGSDESRVDYQIHCGPALGAFNQWVKGTELESWKKRHVDEIAIKIINGAAEVLNKYLSILKY